MAQVNIKDCMVKVASPVRLIPTDSVWVNGPALRAPDEDCIKSLMVSFKDVGLYVPLSVKNDNGRTRLVDGLHRWLAWKRLDEPMIPVVYGDGYRASAKPYRTGQWKVACNGKACKPIPDGVYHSPDCGRYAASVGLSYTKEALSVPFKPHNCGEGMPTFPSDTRIPKPCIQPGCQLPSETSAGNCSQHWGKSHPGWAVGGMAPGSLVPSDKFPVYIQPNETVLKLNSSCTRCGVLLTLGATTCGPCYVEKRTQAERSQPDFNMFERQILGAYYGPEVVIHGPKADIQFANLRAGKRRLMFGPVKAAVHPADRGKKRCLNADCKVWVRGNFCKAHKVLDPGAFPKLDRDGDPIWVTKERQVIKVKDLGDQHLTNVVTFLKRQADERAQITGCKPEDLLKKWGRYDYLVDEMKRRDACPDCHDGRVPTIDSARNTVDAEKVSLMFEDRFCTKCTRGEERSASKRVAVEMSDQAKKDKRKLTLKVAMVMLMALVTAGAYGTSFIPLVIEQLKMLKVLR